MLARFRQYIFIELELSLLETYLFGCAITKKKFFIVLGLQKLTLWGDFAKNHTYSIKNTNKIFLGV